MTLWNQNPILDSLARINQVLIIVKDHFKLFLFSKTQRHISVGTKDENCLRCQFTVKEFLPHSETLRL